MSNPHAAGSMQLKGGFMEMTANTAKRESILERLTVVGTSWFHHLCLSKMARGGSCPGEGLELTGNRIEF